MRCRSKANGQYLKYCDIVTEPCSTLIPKQFDIKLKSINDTVNAGNAAVAEALVVWVRMSVASAAVGPVSGVNHRILAQG